MGYSLGGEAAQQFTVSYLEKVSRLILVATSCGGKDSMVAHQEAFSRFDERLCSNQRQISINVIDSTKSDHDSGHYKRKPN